MTVASFFRRGVGGDVGLVVGAGAFVLADRVAVCIAGAMFIAALLILRLDKGGSFPESYASCNIKGLGRP